MKKYRLIKKLPFPRSPEIGFISTPKWPNDAYDSHLHYWNRNWFEPANYPEYWEEIVEKEYEILSFMVKYIDTVLHKNHNYGNFYVSCINWDGEKHRTEEFLLRNNKTYSIHSVKRLSDGEIFTVGDNVEFYGVKTKIKEIYFNEHEQLSYRVEGKKPPLVGVFMKNNVHLKKLKKPLFTTEDGVDIFEGDTFCWVKVDDKKRPIYAYNFISIARESELNKDVLVFSTKEKAKNYVLMNKPCLSINDVLSISYNPVESKTSTTDKLKQLVKSNL